MVRRAFSLGLLLTLGACSGSPAPLQPDGGACPTPCGAGSYCCQSSFTCEPEQRTCSNLQSCPAGQELSYPDPPYMDSVTCQPIPLQCECRPAQGLKPGLVGRFSALGATADTLMASAYESRFGDLVLVSLKADALDGAPQLELVDGVPSQPPTQATDGWRGGVEEPGDDVGQGTDLVVGPAGEPIIAYYDATHRALKVAIRAAGVWKVHTVDQAKTEKDQVGRYPSLLLRDGKPAVAYLALSIPGSGGSFTSELRWAEAKLPNPGAASDWTLQVIESKAMPCQNLCPKGEVCALKSDGSSACQPEDSGCPSCAADEACLNGGCSKILPDLAYSDLPRASGLWPAAVSTSAGPLVVYHDRTGGWLRAAVRGSGGDWKRLTLAGNGTDNQGAFPSAVCDGKNLVHVAFQDATRQALKYLQLDAATLVVSAPELIDDGLRSDGPHPVGADSAIVLDGSGAVRVVYQDQLNSDLLGARRSAPGQWGPKLTAEPNLGRLVKGGAKAYGFFSDLVVMQGGAVLGSTFFYDPQSNPNGGLSFFALPN